jgi:hypothetical protein
MSKTFKDKPDKYRKEKQTKEERRFESSKGRKNNSNLKDLVRKGYNLEDYFND